MANDFTEYLSNPGEPILYYTDYPRKRDHDK